MGCAQWIGFRGRASWAVATVATVAATAVAWGLSASPAAADYGPGYFSTELVGQAAIYSEPGSDLAKGTQSVWTPAYAAVSGYPSAISVNATPANGGSWTFEFEAPSGETLQPGVYDDAAGSPAETIPAITATNDGEECGGGRFQIENLTSDSTGTPTQFWVVFEVDCGDGEVFGELRLGEAPDDATLPSTPSLVRWPAYELGATETPVPVQFTATQAADIEGVTLTGSDPADFRITQDGCSGLQLVAQGSCEVWVDFDPAVAGTRIADLTVTDASGATHSLPLQGFTYGGTTRFVASSDPGDHLADGNDYSFNGPADDVWADGTPGLINFFASDGTNDFQGQFAPPPGQTLTTGSQWTEVARYPFNGSDAGMDINFDSSGCDTVSGEFSVASATYDSHDQLTSVDITYQQVCEDSTGALHGELQWRAGDDVTPAPWMEPDATGAPSNGGDGGGGAPGAGAQDPTAPSGVQTTGGTALAAGPGSGSVAGNTDSSGSADTSTAPRSTLPPARSVAKTLHGLPAALSRESRQASDAIDGTLHRSGLAWVARVQRSVNNLRRTISATQQQLRRQADAHSSDVRRVLHWLAAWQSTLTAEQRVLSSPHLELSTELLRLVAQANRQAAATLHAIDRLEDWRSSH